MKGSRDSTQNNREEKEIDKQSEQDKGFRTLPKRRFAHSERQEQTGYKADFKCARLQLKWGKSVQGKCTLEKLLKSL